MPPGKLALRSDLSADSTLHPRASRAAVANPSFEWDAAAPRTEGRFPPPTAPPRTNSLVSPLLVDILGGCWVVSGLPLRGDRVPRPAPLCLGGRPLEDEFVLVLVPAPDVLDKRREGESALGGRLGVFSLISLHDGCDRSVRRARLGPRGHLGGRRRPAVGGAFRPGGRPPEDNLVVVLVTTQDVLDERLEGEPTLGTLGGRLGGGPLPQPGHRRPRLE